MQHLIYLSSATNLYSEMDLIEILAKSRINNARLGVTGLLLYHDRSILQILEGENDIIHRLFDVISQDPRHQSILKLVDESIEERSFQEWSMGFKQVSDFDWTELQGHLSLNKKGVINEVTSLNDRSVVSFIKAFGQVNTLPLI